ncbi:MAG: winged helix-turn-helix domain-containing protein [Burkholderiales bacterium]
MTTSYRFGRFELRPDENALLADGRAVPLGQRALDVLRVLVERRDRLVTKAELFDDVWPGLVVEENNLQVQVSALRKIVGLGTIATVPGRGYRFAATLDGNASPAAPDDAPVERIGNVARDLPPLYGREDDVTALRELLGTHRLVTLVGAGGIGKSRLATAIAQMSGPQWSEAWIVELVGVADPALVAGTLAHVLGVQASDASELATVLAPRRAFVVVDNCEHVLDGVSRVIQPILDEAPGITILATSQEPLRLPTEQQYRILPLAVPGENASGAREYGAVKLLEARVRAANPRFVLQDADLPVAADICRRLDGLPLAIELAAARVAALGLRPVRDKLDARFKLLTGGARHTLRRHQTLRAALEWSYGLLDEDERRVFRRLGTFSGGFTIELAQAVARDESLDEWRVLDLLTQLVDKSLVSVDPGDPPRYRLLESARAFALEQLGEDGADAMRRHAHAMRDFVVEVDTRHQHGLSRSTDFAAIAMPELDNLRAAYAWARTEADMPLAVAIAAHCGALADHAGECIDWILTLPDDALTGVPDWLEARFLQTVAGSNMFNHVPSDRRIRSSRRAAEIYRKIGDARRLFLTLVGLSGHLHYSGDDAGAERALEEARSLLRADWPAKFRVWLLRYESANLIGLGRLDEAAARIEESIDVAAAAGDWRLEFVGHNYRNDLTWLRGPIEKAVAQVRATHERLRASRLTMDIHVASHYANLVGILAERGDVAGALAAARESMPCLASTRSASIEAWLYLLWQAGRVDDAARMLGAMEQHTSRVAQDNERRLLEKTRAGLAAALPPERLAALTREGAALTHNGVIALIDRAIG